MRALHGGALDDALTAIDQAHDQLARDRATLDAVRAALAARPGHVTGPGLTGRTIGELARRLGVTPATVRAWERAGVLTPGRDPATGYRVFDAGDTRDADLAHLLRRGGYRLDRIATVVRQVRAAGGTPDLARAVADWQRRLTARGLGMLDAAAALSRYLRLAPAYDGSPAGRT
jgi:DNA-binding transcriptional MerR regulator